MRAVCINPVNLYFLFLKLNVIWVIGLQPPVIKSFGNYLS